MNYSCHVMIDIETLSTEPNAAILSIGACAFDMLDKEEDISHTFFKRVSLESNFKHDRHVSSDTLSWWFKQSPEAQEATFNGPATSLSAALSDFNLWIHSLNPRPTHVWAKDPDFDVVIMRSACAAVGLPFPFNYWQSRSVRTIVELAYPARDEPRFSGGVQHSAMDDAVFQAMLTKLAYHRLL